MENGNNGRPKPVSKILAGCVTAVLWKNMIRVNGGLKPTFNVSIERRYKDKDGNWKNTGSLKPNDIPKAIAALRRMYDHLFIDMPLKQRQQSQERQVEQPVQEETIEGYGLDAVDEVMGEIPI